MTQSLKKAIHIVNGRIANNGKFAAIDQAVISLANFGASILLVALVTPTEVGVYVIGFLAIYFVRAVQNGIIVQPINTYGASKTEEAFQIYFTAIAIQQIILAAITALAAALLGWILTQTGNDILGPALFALWFSFFTWQLQELLRRAFYTRGEVHKGMWVSTCANGIRLGIIVILASLRPINGITGLYAIGWGSLGGTLLGIWLGKGYFTLKFQNLMMIWQDNWRFGRWILGASVADWVVVDLYPIMMAGMINFAATGVYQALNNLVAPIHVLLRAVDTFATPVLAKTFDQDGLAKVNQNLRLIYVICAIPVGILLVLVLVFAPQLLTLLRGETYLPYTDAIYLMAIFYFFLFINRPLQMVFRAIRQGKQIFWANVGAAISMFAGGYWLINRWGIYGGIGGQALNAFIISAVLLIGWLRIMRVKEPNQKEGDDLEQAD